jgi:ribosomal-protein-serine acetyltransferase
MRMTEKILTELASLSLKLLEEEDADELFLESDQNRKHLRNWMPWVDGTKSVTDTLDFIRMASKAAEDGTQFHYAILLDEKLVGVVGFNRIEKNNRCATMGYWLAKPQTGRGLMTTAVRALISEGFRQLYLNRIEARVATGNHSSQAVCDRVGLKKEGVLRQAEWLYDHYVDLTMNSILKSEWEQIPSQSS